jgi:2-polyprenyl-3-methyl-5-hydroxy-6-metoxy-1,4-benzoquinol methylase
VRRVQDSTTSSTRNPEDPARIEHEYRQLDPEDPEPVIKAIAHKLGRAYVNKLVGDEFRYQTFRRHNERPIEFGFVFQQVATLRPVTVLDIGSGITALPHMLWSCGSVVTAIDNVTDYWDEGMVNRHWRVLDDNILSPKLRQRFDMVTCVSVIEHIENHQAAFRNMVSLLKPGGHLILTTPYSEYHAVANVYELPGAAYGQDVPYICRSTSRAELDAWLADTGAELVELQHWQLWSGHVWTQGQFLLRPRRVGRDDPHQLGLMLFRRAA